MVGEDTNGSEGEYIERDERKWYEIIHNLCSFWKMNMNERNQRDILLKQNMNITLFISKQFFIYQWNHDYRQDCSLNYLKPNQLPLDCWHIQTLRDIDSCSILIRWSKIKTEL
jgi:hypothetical protein